MDKPTTCAHVYCSLLSYSIIVQGGVEVLDCETASVCVCVLFKVGGPGWADVLCILPLALD